MNLEPNGDFCLHGTVKPSRRTTAITQRKRRRERNHQTEAQPPFPLGVSRPGSLGFRIRFVFPVVHPFPLVVSQYLIRVQLTPGPSQNRACAVNAPGSPPAPAGLTPVAWTPANRPKSGTVSGGRLGRHAYWLGCLPCTGITRLRSTRLGFELQRYYASFGLPVVICPPCLRGLSGILGRA